MTIEELVDLQEAGARARVLGMKPHDKPRKHPMDQLVKKTKSTAARLKASRLARGYSLEDFAIATGLTISEIKTAEDELTSAPASHMARIERVVS
ncbi:hypothetical protein ACIQUB_01080 [Rhizobium sp. NPDC090275]|uniref:hypothetical protein n=1 Tax=Rhizobium sp. NPDC090275 TaxID=3364498 RepID=UPI003839D840